MKKKKKQDLVRSLVITIAKTFYNYPRKYKNNYSRGNCCKATNTFFGFFSLVCFWVFTQSTAKKFLTQPVSEPSNFHVIIILQLNKEKKNFRLLTMIKWHFKQKRNFSSSILFLRIFWEALNKESHIEIIRQTHFRTVKKLSVKDKLLLLLFLLPLLLLFLLHLQ